MAWHLRWMLTYTGKGNGFLLSRSTFSINCYLCASSFFRVLILFVYSEDGIIWKIQSNQKKNYRSWLRQWVGWAPLMTRCLAWAVKWCIAMYIKMTRYLALAVQAVLCYECKYILVLNDILWVLSVISIMLQEMFVNIIILRKSIILAGAEELKMDYSRKPCSA